jgi:6-phosphofructokinase 1
VAGGAEIVLIPEIPFRIEKILARIVARKAAGHRFSVVVVAEGCSVQDDDPIWLAHKASPQFIEKKSIGNLLGALIPLAGDHEVRVTVLGHLQRGGSPSPFDRLLGTRLGVAAVDLVAQKQFGRMVCLKGDTISSCTLEEAVGRMKTVPSDCDTVRAARAIGISFGAD